MVWGLLLMLAACIVFAAFGLRAYVNSEATEYNRLTKQVHELDVEVSGLRLSIVALGFDKKALVDQIAAIQKQCDTNATDMRDNHEHLTKVREQQYLINERDNSAKTMSVKMDKPIEVTIVEKAQPVDSTGMRRFTTIPKAKIDTKNRSIGADIHHQNKKKVLKKVKSQLKELSR